MIDALLDTSVLASTRLKNAAIPYVHFLIDTSVGFISVSTRSSTTWKDMSFIIKQYANVAEQVKAEFKNIVRAGDEAEIAHHEATIDPKVVRFTRKQSLICQVLIACSDAQTMTGICLIQNGAGKLMADFLLFRSQALP